MAQTWLGQDVRTLERLRRHRRVRVWVALVWLLLAVAIAAVGVVAGAASSPRRIEQGLAIAFRRAPFTLRLQDFEVLPVGRLADPRTWRFVVSGLSFTPFDPKKPSWRVDRARMGLPTATAAAGGGIDLHFPTLHVDDLVIEAHQQRPPPPWTPRDDFVRSMRVSHVDIHGASFSAPEDPPIGAARVERIEGRLHDLVWRPGRREVSAKGALTIRRFTTGAITVTDVVLDPVELDRSTLTFAGDFDLGRSEGELAGTIRTFHIKSAVELDVEMRDAELEQVVEIATGNDSPVAGELDMSLRVRAGGERPRGGAVLEGDLVLRSGRVQLGPDAKPLILDLIRIAPWVRLNAARQVVLEETRGRVTFTRGEATLKELTYPAGRRKIRVDGTIGEEIIWLVIRLTPLPDRVDATGLGVVLYGTRGNQRFRLAGREDLLREEPWVPLFEPSVTLPSVVPAGAAGARRGKRRAEVIP